MAGDTAEELERFRQQWQQEVTQRVKEAPSASVKKPARPPHPSQNGSGAIPPERAAPPLIRRRTREAEEHDEDLGGEGHHDLEDKDDDRRLGEAGERTHPSNKREPHSALDHYELAVERESEGILGDSLNHYRKAYRVRIEPFPLEACPSIEYESSSMPALTASIRTSTSRLPPSLQNRQTQTHQTPLSQSQTPPTTP